MKSFDVVVIGGAFAGSATAVLLKRQRPETRVLIVERAEEFDRKVGEATVEISGFFLSHVLRAYDLLSREHLPKHGLRYWFGDGEGRSLGEMSEVGATLVPSLPSFLLDRAKLDESLLEMARAEGCEVLRPAKVASAELEWPENRIRVECDGVEEEITARWVVDASGRQAFLSRRAGTWQRYDDHPTAALWGRWRGVRDMDGPESLGDDPRDNRLARGMMASRRLCTNHFCGYGYWIWTIPLSGGETSVGLVYDKQLFSLPGEGALREKYERFVRGHDGLFELLDSAELDEDDFRSYDHLAFRSEQYIDRGWALVGDAGSFIDPYYSPGLDHASISSYATARVIGDELIGKLEGASLDEAIATHRDQFHKSYDRTYQALYQHKYEVLGDAELTAATFFLDTSMYYLGVVHPVYDDVEGLKLPMFALDNLGARLALRWMRFYGRRLAAIGRSRRERGTYGRRNVGWRCFGTSFGDASLTLSKAHRKGLRLWWGMEARNLWERMRHSIRGSASTRRPIEERA